MLTPGPADAETLGMVHTAGYIDAVRRASRMGFPFSVGHGLGTADNPIFPGMHETAALIAGGSVAAARAIARGEVDRAVNFCGGLHHAMADYASGFCVYNDAALGIAALLREGVRKVAYVDVDAHHGDGVQAAFYDDPRVLTVSIHQTPLSLFPGTGFPTECGARRGATARRSTSRCRRARRTPRGCGPSTRWCPGVVRAFRPEVLVTQHGTDSHREDPLADLNLTVDGQRTSYLALRELAETVTGGRWLALGGGGYSPVRVVPRSWTHLLAIVSGHDLDPATPLPETGSRRRRRRPARRSSADRHVRRRAGPGDLPTAGTGRSTWRSTAPSWTPGASSTRCTASTPMTPGTDRRDRLAISSGAPVTAAPHPSTRCIGRPTSLLADGGVAHLRPVRSGRRRGHPRHARPVERENAVPAVLLGGQRGLRPSRIEIFTDVDYDSRVGLVAVLGGQMIAAGTYHRDPVGDTDRPRSPSWSRTRSSAAGSVRSCWSTWPRPPRSAGSAVSPPRCSARTPQMLRVFMDAGYSVHREYDSGVIDLAFDIEPTEKSRAVMTAREHRAEARSIARLLVAAVDRGHRRLRPSPPRWATSCWRTCCAATSPGRCTR